MIRHASKRVSLLIGVLFVGCFSAPSSWGAEGEGHSGHGHLGLFVGVGEGDSGSSTNSAKAAGLVYEYKFGNGWDLGGAVEGLDVHGHSSTIGVVEAGYTLANGFRLFGGPGFELKSNPAHDKWLMRAGVNYEFHINDKWTLAPEVYFDAIENGASVWMVGFVLGYGL